MDWLKCNICFRCLTNTIQMKSLVCPQCRKIHDINSVTDFPINFVIDGLLKSLPPCSQNISDGTISGQIMDQSDQDNKGESFDSPNSFSEQKKSFSAQKELFKASAGMCYEHPTNELIYRCSAHKCWVCEKCIEERGDHPKHYCTITSFKEEMERRRQAHKITLENEEKSCDETFLLIEKHISYLSEKREHHNSLLGILRDLENLHKTEDEYLQREIESFKNKTENGKLVKQSLIDVQAIILDTKSLDESTAARDMVENKKIDARNWHKRTELEVNEGKIKVQSSNNLEIAEKYLMEYREKIGLMQDKLEETTNQSNQNLVSEDIELMSKNESGISEAPHEDVCNSHNELIENWCITCQRWICESCLKSHTTITGCLTITFDAALEYMIEEHTENAEDLLSTFEKDTNYLFSKIQKLKVDVLEITNKQKVLSEKAAEHATELDKLQCLLSQGKKLNDNVVDSMNHLKDTNSPNSCMVSIEVLDEMKIALRSWAIMNLGRDNTDDSIPQYLERYDRLQKRIVSGPVVYMQLTAGGLMKAIMIRLNVNLPIISQHMVNVVTEENGLSFTGTDFDYKDDFCIGKENLPFNGVHVIPDSSDISICERGDVVAFYENDHLSAIYFQVKKYDYSIEEKRSNFRKIGTIVFGLDILQWCYDYHSKGAKIIDCGLVLGEFHISNDDF